MDKTTFTAARMDRLTPYVAGEQPKDKQYIKLNTNENPYPPSPSIKDAILSELENLYLYPDPDSFKLREAIASDCGVSPEYVFCGNGSDEVLSFVFYAFFGDNRLNDRPNAEPMLFPDITYSFYPVYAAFYNILYKTIPLDENFRIIPADYSRPSSGVIFPNPNAPTSVCLEYNEIRELLEYHKERVVAVDEAYIAFGGESMVKYIDKYPNLLIIRTLSKSHSLAGMRVGFAVGQPHLISALKRVKDSFNSYPVDRIAAAAAVAAITDKEYFNKTTAKIINTRERFIENIKEIGFSVSDSKANFVFISHKTVKADILKAKLTDSGILVRHFDKPRINNHLRVTIGTDKDMDYVSEVLRKFAQ